MKNRVAVILAAVVGVGLVACSGNADPSAAPVSSGAPSAQVSEAPKSPSASPSASAEATTKSSSGELAKGAKGKGPGTLDTWIASVEVPDGISYEVQQYEHKGAFGSFEVDFDLTFMDGVRVGFYGREMVKAGTDLAKDYLEVRCPRMNTTCTTTGEATHSGINYAVVKQSFGSTVKILYVAKKPIESDGGVYARRVQVDEPVNGKPEVTKILDGIKVKG